MNFAVQAIKECPSLDQDGLGLARFSRVSLVAGAQSTFSIACTTIGTFIALERTFRRFRNIATSNRGFVQQCMCTGSARRGH